MPAATSFSELSPGQLITVVGEERADGAIAARSILITPDLGILMRGGRPARRGGQAGGRGGAPVTPTETPSLSFNNQRQPGEYEGITFVVAAGSEATFTAKERLALLPLPNAVVMRTEALTGEVHLDGGPSVVEIDLHQLSSDQRLRDGYVRRQMFADHPIATFTLENLGPLPSGFAAGDKVTTQVTGRLNIRGIEVPLSFDVTASDDGDAVNILAETSFVWSDFGLTKPAVSFVLSVDDEVKVRVALALKPIR